MTDLDLNKFYQTAVARGFSRDYQLRITEIKINNQQFWRDNLVYVKSAAVPGVKTSVTTVVYNGITFNFPALQDFKDKDSYSLTFFADKVLKDRAWFMERLKERAPNNFNGTPRLLQRVPAVPDASNYIDLSVIDDNLNEVHKFKLIGAFIKDVGDIKYTMEGTGKVQEFNVVFGFIDCKETSYFELAKIESALKTEPGAIPQLNPLAAQTAGQNVGGGGTGIFDSILQGLGTIAQTANAVRGTANAVRGATVAVRGANRAIRGR